jgi:hypothetical protein
MSDHTIGSGPIEPQYAARMQAMGSVIDDFLNGPKPAQRKNGFILMVFEMGDIPHGRMNYLSNARREDVVTALKEQLSYFEGMPDSQRDPG